jgi:hypothetical protein
MAQRKPRRQMSSGNGEPLFAIPSADGLHTEYYVSEAEADAATGPSAISAALALAGAWSDFDWDGTEAELARIRHATDSTPPIDTLDCVE